MNTSQDLIPGRVRYMQLPKQVFNAVRVFKEVLRSKRLRNKTLEETVRKSSEDEVSMISRLPFSDYTV
jgi:hypothetical protein